MKRSATMLGLWVVHIGGVCSTLLARVQDELYVLAFSSAVRAGQCLGALGAVGTPFYVCSANVGGVVREARDSGARGFIIDYDPARAMFSSAHPLPSAQMLAELV
jgi:hypothetical protein